MDALVVSDGRVALDTDHPLPVRRPGEVLIRVLLSGICNTDLEILKGYKRFSGVPGHEFVGIVEESDEPVWIGRRVVGDINCSCGSCSTCLAGNAPHCPHRTTLGISGRDGAMAEYCVLPVQNLIPVPDGVVDEAAVFCEPLAAALEILQRIHIRPGDEVMVVGDGKLGLLIAQTLRLTGCSLLAVGRHEEKLEILKRIGVQTALASSLTEGLNADVVVECSGRPDGFAFARRQVRPRGKLVLKTTVHEESHVDLTGLVVDEIEVVGSRCGPLAPALRLLDQGLLDWSSLVDAEYPLRKGEEAFRRAGEPGALKILVRP